VENLEHHGKKKREFSGREVQNGLSWRGLATSLRAVSAQGKLKNRLGIHGSEDK